MTATTSAQSDALARAAEWFVLLSSGKATDADRTRCQQWRAADRVNEQAWLRVQSVSSPLSGLPRTEALAAMRALTKKSNRRRVLGTLVVATMSALSWHGYRVSDVSADARTRPGEQRELQLVDDSRLMLDSDTVVDITIDDAERTIRVRRGRVFIETGHREEFSDRPFTATTAEARVVALGTQFTVEQMQARTRVAVLQSRVEVSTNAGTAVIVEQGGAARIAADGLSLVPMQRNDSAWRRGVFVAEDVTLNEVVEVLDVYYDGELRCDANAAHLRVSGVFPLKNTEIALTALSETLPVRFEHGAEGSLVVKRK